MISSIRIMFFSLPLRTFMLGRNLFRLTEKRIGFLVSNIVAECLKIKDILRTFYPQFGKILRTSRGKIFFPGPYIKKECKNWMSKKRFLPYGFFVIVVVVLVVVVVHMEQN